MLPIRYSLTWTFGVSMADVVIPALSDGTVLSSSAVSTALYEDGTGNTSFAMINGRLDNTNRRTTWEVDTSQVQAGALSRGRTIGSTINTDVFANNFTEYTFSTDSAQYYVALPGGSQNFYLPYACSLVAFSWSISAQAKEVGALEGRIRPYLNGTKLTGTKEMMLDIPGEPSQTHVGKFTRAWTGHHLETGGLAKGWHSFSLRIAAEMGSSQTIRVRCRHLDYVYFK